MNDTDYDDMVQTLDKILDTDIAWHQLTDRERELLSYHIGTISDDDRAAEDADLRVKALKEH